jgi:hypothetical protein
MDAECGPTSLHECKNEAHYWVLDGKNLGVCKKCGATKQFNAERWVWQRRKVVISKSKAAD